MLKQLSSLEHKIGDKVYSFLCDPNSPLNEIKDSLFQFISYVTQIENAAKANQEAQNALEKVEPTEQPKEAENVESCQ